MMNNNPTKKVTATKAATGPTNPHAFSVDGDGQPVPFFYDMPGFISPEFNRAADAIDFWIRQHTQDRVRDAEDNARSGSLTGQAAVLANIGLTRPSWDQDFGLYLNFEPLLAEVLEETVVEVHSLASADRGHYLAQVLTRWHADGHLDWARFLLGSFLADYFEAMPIRALALGAIDLRDCDGVADYRVLIGWDTRDGVFVDVVHQGRQDPTEIAIDVNNAMTVGNDRWGARFAGVRYLPLGDMDHARLYEPDGTWVAASDYATLLANQQPTRATTSPR